MNKTIEFESETEGAKPFCLSVDMKLLDSDSTQSHEVVESWEKSPEVRAGVLKRLAAEFFLKRTREDALEYLHKILLIPSETDSWLDATCLMLWLIDCLGIEEFPGQKRADVSKLIFFTPEWERIMKLMKKRAKDFIPDEIHKAIVTGDKEAIEKVCPWFNVARDLQTKVFERISEADFWLNETSLEK